jgi:hypothetical protein
MKAVTIRKERPMRHAFLAVLLLATPAGAFTAQNGLVVTAEAGDAFTVPWRGKSGAADFWCAAGDYAIRKLGLAPTATIWRASEPPRRAGEGIRFTLRADQAASSTGLIILGAEGAGLSAASAQALCELRRKRH